MIYLDTSAAAKLLIQEPETAQMRRYFEDDGNTFVSSRLLAVELSAVADRRLIPADAAQEVLDHVALISLDDDVADGAIALHSGLRTLDALHLATAVRVKDTIDGILTFDRELGEAAERAGIPRLQI